MLSKKTLTHLRYLEAESIHIMREVAAEFENSVMLYSIGRSNPFPLMRYSIEDDDWDIIT